VHLVLAGSMRRFVTGNNHPTLIDRWQHPMQFCRVRVDLHADEISGVEAR
jgi:hypothetical protein